MIRLGRAVEIAEPLHGRRGPLLLERILRVEIKVVAEAANKSRILTSTGQVERVEALHDLRIKLLKEENAPLVFWVTPLRPIACLAVCCRDRVWFRIGACWIAVRGR